ncbi:MAG: stage II sporulation protein P [Clostridia bacterium]|nr:stage II sporulation protein P [Clostridia bacterium]
MRDGYAIARLIACYLLCFFFLGYFIWGSVNTIPEKKPTFTDTFLESAENTSEKEENSSVAQQTESSSAETTQSEATDTSSVEASAAAIKGKITTRYISPYTAPLSYDSVYLKNSTSLDIDLKALLNQKLKFKIAENSEPQVLIMHTHTTESFMQKESEYYTEDDNPRSTDNSKNMVKIGSIIAKKLNDSGIKTLHDTTKHDYPEYTGSYGRSAATVNSYLKKYPSIKVVIDLHRDSVSTDDGKAKLVTEIGGKKAAQVMLVMGSQSGSVKDYPNWKENLSLAIKLQQKFELQYPTLARPILLRSSKYNQNLTTGSFLLEVGTEANTMEEATYSAELVGEALVSLLKTIK